MIHLDLIAIFGNISTEDSFNAVFLAGSRRSHAKRLHEQIVVARIPTESDWLDEINRRKQKQG
jgi:hypothetical protein